MNTDLLGFVLAKLDLRTPAWTEVARCTGVPYDTLKKIAKRRTPNPGVQHVQRIADFFMAREPRAVEPAGGPLVERRDLTSPSVYAGTDIDRRAPAGDA
jgi:hypothetical protein